MCRPVNRASAPPLSFAALPRMTVIPRSGIPLRLPQHYAPGRRIGPAVRPCQTGRVRDFLHGIMQLCSQGAHGGIGGAWPVIKMPVPVTRLMTLAGRRAEYPSRGRHRSCAGRSSRVSHAGPDRPGMHMMPNAGRRGSVAALDRERHPVPAPVPAGSAPAARPARQAGAPPRRANPQAPRACSGVHISYSRSRLETSVPSQREAGGWRSSVSSQASATDVSR